MEEVVQHVEQIHSQAESGSTETQFPLALDARVETSIPQYDLPLPEDFVDETISEDVIEALLGIIEVDLGRPKIGIGNLGAVAHELWRYRMTRTACRL